MTLGASPWISCELLHISKEAKSRGWRPYLRFFLKGAWNHNWIMCNRFKFWNTRFLTIKFSRNIESRGPPWKSQITNFTLSACLMVTGKYHKGGSRGVLSFENNVRNFISWKNHYDIFSSGGHMNDPHILPLEYQLKFQEENMGSFIWPPEEKCHNDFFMK